jgi:hypothetical protein
MPVHLLQLAHQLSWLQAQHLQLLLLAHRQMLPLLRPQLHRTLLQHLQWLHQHLQWRLLPHQHLHLLDSNSSLQKKERFILSFFISQNNLAR